MPISPSTSKTVAQIILKGNLGAMGSNAHIVALTFWYRRTSIVAAPSKLALSNAFLAGPYAAMLAAFHQSWTLGNTNIRWFDDALDPTVITTLAGVGAIATDRAPSYTSVFMSYKSAVRGRSYIGSKHFPAVNEIDTTGDVLTGAGLTRWQAVATACFAPLVDATPHTWNPCIVSIKKSTYRTNPTAVEYNDVTSIVLDTNVGIMRRRKSITVI